MQLATFLTKLKKNLTTADRNDIVVMPVVKSCCSEALKMWGHKVSPRIGTPLFINRPYEEKHESVSGIYP